MSINKQELTKLYYQISEVASMFNLSTSTLRYWESEFSNIRPKKSRRGERTYQKKDIIEVERIFTLVKKRGFTIEGAKKELLSQRTADKNDHKKEVIKKLIDLRSKLNSLLDRL